jgi:putative resolvase
MKLSAYATAVGVTSKTAYQWWKVGQLDASQLPTGTISVREAQPRITGVALSACASSAEQQDDLTRQAGRLRDYAAARGSHVVAEVTEIASGLNEERPKRTQLLSDHRVGVIVVEQRDRLTRFGSGAIATLFEQQGRRVEALFPTDSGDELVNDFVAVITSLAARRLAWRRPVEARRADAGLCQAG